MFQVSLRKECCGGNEGGIAAGTLLTDTLAYRTIRPVFWSVKQIPCGFFRTSELDR